MHPLLYRNFENLDDLLKSGTSTTFDDWMNNPITRSIMSRYENSFTALNRPWLRQEFHQRKLGAQIEEDNRNARMAASGWKIVPVSKTPKAAPAKKRVRAKKAV